MVRPLQFVKTLLIALFLAPFMSLAAQAHFTVGSDARIIHVDAAPNGEGLVVFLRIPGPLAYGEALSRRGDPSELVEAPFLTMTMVQGVPFYSIDQALIHSQPTEFKNFLASGYTITLEGDTITPEVMRAAYYRLRDHPEYDDAKGARDAFNRFEKTKLSPSPEPIYIADALFDLALFIPAKNIKGVLTIRNALPKFALPPDIAIENLVLDHRFFPPYSVQFTGQMMEPVTLDGSWLASLTTFIWQGIIHILIGLDHVLFVICLALASGLSLTILWSVTGFTLGHSVTLFLGSIGLAPEGMWFIPAVETAIAASILFAASLVILQQYQPNNNSRMVRTNLFLIAAVIGLIHGYGFSFVLGDLLGGGTGQLVLALIGFNIGVEVGQVGIVLLVFALLWLSSRIHPLLPKGLSYAGSFVAVYMSVIWCWERAQFLFSLISH